MLALIRFGVLSLLFAACLAASAAKLPSLVRRRSSGGSSGGGGGKGGGGKGGRGGGKFGTGKSKRPSTGAIGGIDGGGEEEEESACFPARARVQLRDGFARMDALRVGDTVRTGVENYSDVFMFSHAVRHGIFKFVQIGTDAGALAASPGHFVHTARGSFAASAVVVGDYFRNANGSFAKVRTITKVIQEGLYNPHTIDGDIVVDGFIVSAYTTAVPGPAAACMLAPVRATYVLFGIDLTWGTMAHESILRKTLYWVWKSRASG